MILTGPSPAGCLQGTQPLACPTALHLRAAPSCCWVAPALPLKLLSYCLFAGSLTAARVRPVHAGSCCCRTAPPRYSAPPVSCCCSCCRTVKFLPAPVSLRPAQHMQPSPCICCTAPAGDSHPTPPPLACSPTTPSSSHSPPSVLIPPPWPHLEAVLGQLVCVCRGHNHITSNGCVHHLAGDVLVAEAHHQAVLVGVVLVLVLGGQAEAGPVVSLALQAGGRRQQHSTAGVGTSEQMRGAAAAAAAAAATTTAYACSSAHISHCASRCHHAQRLCAARSSFPVRSRLPIIGYPAGHSWRAPCCSCCLLPMNQDPSCLLKHDMGSDPDNHCNRHMSNPLPALAS